MVTFCFERKQLLFQIEFSCTTKCNGCVLVVCVGTAISHFHLLFSVFERCKHSNVFNLCVNDIVDNDDHDSGTDRQTVRDWQYRTENCVKSPFAVSWRMGIFLYVIAVRIWSRNETVKYLRFHLNKHNRPLNTYIRTFQCASGNEQCDKYTPHPHPHTHESWRVVEKTASECFCRFRFESVYNHYQFIFNLPDDEFKWNGNMRFQQNHATATATTYIYGNKNGKWCSQSTVDVQLRAMPMLMCSHRPARLQCVDQENGEK